MRRPDVVDPAVAADLEALDAALAGDPAADPGLALLAGDVRAAADRPTPAFRARLDARVASGFARPPRGRPAWRRALAPVAGVAAAAALGLGVVVLAGDGGGGGEPAGLQGAGSARTGGSAGAGARQRAGGTAGLEGPGSAGTSSSAGAGARQRAGATAGSGDLGGGGGGAVGVAPDAATAAPGRRVERGVRLDLRAGLGRFDAVTDGLVRVTQRAGGFVAASEIARTRNAGTATFVLRIPAVRLDAAVAQLSRLAHVRALEQSSQDVTGEWDGVARRLADARTQRRALVAALATATGAQAVRLRARLDRVTARVRGLEEQRRALRGRTRYGTVDATVIARRSGAAAAPPGGSWTPADAWRDARRVLEVAAGVAIVAVAALLPLALLGLAVGAGAQALRRRRREAALG